MKINVTYGVILRHSTLGRLRYFHASSNNATVFPVARTISNRADLNQLIETFEGLDPAQLGINRRDGSAWILQALTNVTFYVYKLLGVNRVGCTRAVYRDVYSPVNGLSGLLVVSGIFSCISVLLLLHVLRAHLPCAARNLPILSAVGNH